MMASKLTKQQAADYAAALRDTSKDALEEHIWLMEVYGGWSKYTPHKIQIAYTELEKRP